MGGPAEHRRIRPGTRFRPASPAPVAYRTALPILLAFLLFAARPPAASAAVPAVGQIVLTDQDADPLSRGRSEGGAFIVRYGSDGVRLASVHEHLADPIASVMAPDGGLYILDSGADPLHLGTDYGGLFWVDTRSIGRDAVPVVPSAVFRNPTDLLLEPEGTILVLDSDADPHGWGRKNGAVFRIDPAAGTISVVADPFAFNTPRCLAWDRDGSVLIVDQLANPLGLQGSAGAVFRLNRKTGAVGVVAALTRPTFLSPCAIAVIPSGANEGDYLLVDKDADPNALGTSPGAVFVIHRDGSPATMMVSAPTADFLEPIDLIAGLDNDFLVLDELSSTGDEGKGALFQFGLEQGNLRATWRNGQFRKLSGVMQVTGPELESSQVIWIDESHGVLQPGDILTVRTRLRNTGTEDAPSVSVADTIAGSWSFVAGSDSASSGTVGYDTGAQAVRWQGAVTRDAEQVVRFRIKLSENTPLTRQIQKLTIWAGPKPVPFIYYGFPTREFEPGSAVFVDVGREGTVPVPRLYQVLPDTTLPATLWQGAPLQQPVDTAFLEDGRVAILDTARPSSQSDTTATIYVYTHFPQIAVDPLLVLAHSDGFVAPTGITLDRDGSLLIIDRDANPNSYPSPRDRPGAIFRYRADTHVLSVVASDSLWREPLDGVVDHKGNLLLVDPGRSFPYQDPPMLWSLPPGGLPATGVALPTGMFRSPAGIACDAFDELYVADPRSPAASGSPTRGAVIRIHRGQVFGYAVATADTLLREPADCAVGPDNSLLISDREANPQHLQSGDHGAIFRLDPYGGTFEPAAMQFSIAQPDGPSIYGHPDLAGSTIGISPNADPYLGSPIDLQIAVVNIGSRAASQGVVTLFPSESFSLESGTASSGSILVDAPNNWASWTGRAAIGDTIRISFHGRVRGDARYGDPVGAKITVAGGRSLVTLSRYRSVRARFAPNDILLADPDSNPYGQTDPPGALFRLSQSPGAGVRQLEDAVNRPAALEWNGQGDLVFSVFRRTPPAMVFRFDAQNQRVDSLVTGTNPLRTPVDLLMSPQGELLILDRDAPGPTDGSFGEIFRISNGNAVPVVADSAFRAPTQATFGPGGMLYLVDPKADPGHLGGNTGAIFTIDPATWRRISYFQAPSLPDPTGILAYDDSTMVVTDSLAGGQSGGVHGALFYFRPRTSTLTQFLSPPLFREPWRTFLKPDGQLLILDRKASGLGHSDSTGVVFSYDPPPQSSLQYYAWSDSFGAISDITQKPGPVLVLDPYELEDLNGPPLHPADRVRIQAVIRNSGPALAAGTAWVDSLPPESALLFETATASTGRLSQESNILRWSGDLAPGASVTIGYEAQLNPASSQGKILRFRSWASVQGRAPVSREFFAQTYVPLEPGYLYMTDATAEADQDHYTRGAVYKLDQVTGTAIPMIVSSEFRRVRSIDLAGYAHQSLLVLDDQATRGPGLGTGTLFVIDPVSHDVLQRLGDPSWRAPRQVLTIAPDVALVLDPAADPFGLTPGTGPGAIYQIDLTRGLVSTLCSDTLFKALSSMAMLPSGKLAISDQTADPLRFGDQNGCLDLLDMSTRELRVWTTNQSWRDPIAIVPDPAGGCFMLDQTATPVVAGDGVGSLWRVPLNGQSVLQTVSPLFRKPSGLQLDGNHHAIVLDEIADPLGFGGYTRGSILRWDTAVEGKFAPLAANRNFRMPTSFVLYRDPTPAGALEAEASAREDGILLKWKGAPEEEGVRFLVYRRIATGPDDPGDASPAGYDLVSGTTEYRGPGPHELLDADLASLGWYVYLIAKAGVDGSVSYSRPLLAQAPEITVVLTLFPGMPNPFFPTTSLRFVVPPPGGNVDLSVYDVAGRRVRALLHGAVPSGRHSVLWDGKDQGGHPLSSGIYFARLTRGPETRTARLVLLK